MKSRNVSESETSGVSIDGWKEVTMGDKKPKACIFTKNAGPQFNLLPVQSPWFIFVYFSIMSF
jgi:hypothetical protein